MSAEAGRARAAIVIGSAGSIGSAVAAQFAASGFAVLAVDRQDAGADPRAGVSAYRADLTRRDDLDGLVEWVRSQPVDLAYAVFAAGGAHPAETGPFTDIDDAVTEFSLDVNLRTHILLLKRLIPTMTGGHQSDPLRRSDRAIVLVSSISAFSGFGLAAYSAAKAGLIGLAKGLARELGKDGIRINVVAPGTVPNPRTERMHGDMKRFRDRSALGRFCTPDEVARACYACCVDLTAMTGQTLVIDCGQSL